MRRIRVAFADLNIEFVDREKALEQIRELGEKGTFPVYVIYGPEGCGKTALLKQFKALLEEEFGYYVVYTNPLAEKAEEILQYTPTVKDIVKEVLGLFPEPYSKIVDVAISVASRIIKKISRPRIAVLMDDVFQAVGLNKAEAYVKTLLNLIEWPPAEYERIVVLVASSEGVTRARIGRHNWATLRILWNMGREGFRTLYEVLPGSKPPFEEVWRATGGNPRYLERLLRAGWRVERVVNEIARDKRLGPFAASLSRREVEILEEVVGDPDKLFRALREPEAQSLEKKLIELNMLVEVWERDKYGWIDEPPPERDPELGIGRFYAWQTPLHREAVRRALQLLGVGVQG